MRAPRIRAVPGRLADVVSAGPRIDVLALVVRRLDDAPSPVPGAAQVATALGIDLAAVLTREKVAGRAGEVVRVPWSPDATAPDLTSPGVEKVVLVGVGDGSPQAVREAAAALARAHRGADRLVTTLGTGSAASARALAEGLVLGSYTSMRWGRTEAPRAPLLRVDVVGRLVVEEVERGVAIAEATVHARDLAQIPASIKSPQWMAARGKQAASDGGLALRVHDHEELAREGFGGLVAVGGGAARPPRLVELHHLPKGAGPRTPHVVLVGKGITFDSGGISLKPREAMIPMKTDMTGAAVVLAVLRTCARLGVRARVTGLLPLAENAIGASAYRPGDVVTIWGGRTVEVRNTDAEGRLVLADALAYADATLDPDLIVDVATLTGAATQALGRTHGALFSDDDRLAAALIEAGQVTGERLWRMPLVEDYRASIDSEIADVGQISSAKGAGAVMAALFLREFTGGRRWAHLDIAGPARSERESGLVSKGGTGFGVRLLLRWLETLR